MLEITAVHIGKQHGRLQGCTTIAFLYQIFQILFQSMKTERERSRVWALPDVFSWGGTSPRLHGSCATTASHHCWLQPKPIRIRVFCKEQIPIMLIPTDVFVLFFLKWWNKGLSDLNSEHTSDIIFSMYNIWISLSFSSPTWDVTGVKPPLRPSLVKELVVVWVSGYIWTHAVVPCSLAVGWIIDLVFYRLIHLKHRLLLCSFL